MPTVSSYKQGTPSWIDLQTSDEQGALRFYSQLFGWESSPQEMGPGQYYYMLSLKGSTVGGLFKMSPEMGNHPPYWATYITVDNLEDAANRVREAGGKVVIEPMDVFDAGRMMAIQDPQGAFVNLWQARNHIGSEIVNEPGAVQWNELVTPDPAAASEFYSKVLQAEAGAVPGMGHYHLIKVDGREVAGIMELMPEMGPVPPHWAVYFAAENVDETASRAESLGGKTISPPRDIPGIGRFAVIQDPQGGVFNLFKPGAA